MLLTTVDGIVVAILLLAIALFLFRHRIMQSMGRGQYEQTNVSQVEERTKEILEAEGYKLIQTSPTANLSMQVDGRSNVHGVKAEFVVRKGNKNYVVKLRRGTLSKRLQAIASRRQLLEIFYTYNVKALLLLDLERETIKTISFSTPFGYLYWDRIVIFILGFIVGGLVSYWRLQGGGLF